MQYLRVMVRSAAVLTLVVLVSLPASAQKTPVYFPEARKQAVELARVRSLKGDYQGAADALTEVLAKFDPKLGHSEYDRESVQRLKESYEARVALAAKAPTESRAARALLMDLLTANVSGLEQAKAEDPRIGAILSSLKARDAKAKAFFNGRKVKVTAQGLEPAQNHALIGAVVSSLRALGFDAGMEGTGDEVTLNAGRGETISTTMLGIEGVACHLKVDATWTAKGEPVMTFDLSRRGHGWADLLDRCYADRIKEIGVLGAGIFFKGWDAR